MEINQEKSIVLTPTIAAFEKIISELASLENDTHPELVKLKKEHDDMMSKKFSVLDRYSELEKNLIRAQCQCEMQQAQEEYEDFISQQDQRE